MSIFILKFCIFLCKGIFQQPPNKIIGGFVVPEDSVQFKFTVLVISKQNKTRSSGCGGSLISPNYVLTAAHCVEKSESVKVIQFEPLIKKNTTYEVSDVLLHPKFERTQVFNLYDFAILKLKVPVKKTNFFICLPSNQLGQLVGKNLTISGWGLTSLNMNDNSDVFKSGFVTAMLNSDCSKIYEKLYNKELQEENPGSPYATVFVPQTIICAHGHITKSAPCMGDSGG